ncbi:unnamed protein product, partial [Allacma fusca]
EIGDFENFDLQSHWIQPKINRDFVKVHEPISLKRLVKVYFKEEIQQGIHTALQDAKATMLIFTEVYIKIKKSHVSSKDNMNVDEFADFDVELDDNRIKYGSIY